MPFVECSNGVCYAVPQFIQCFTKLPSNIYNDGRLLFFDEGEYTEKDIKKIYKEAINYVFNHRYVEFPNKAQFLFMYAFRKRPINFVNETKFMLMGTSKLRKYTYNTVRELWRQAKYGSEVETGLSYDQLTRDIKMANDYNYYEDGSCGYEFPTPAFNDWNRFEEHLWTLKKTIYAHYGHKYFNPSYGAGGHFNISTVNFTRNWRNVTVVMYAYAPLLIYLFQKKWTARRDPEFRYMSNYAYLLSNVWDKYHFLHIKDYAYEIRFPDSLYNVDAYLTEAAILTGLVLTAIAGKVVSKRLLHYQPDYFYMGMIRDELAYNKLTRTFNSYIKYGITSLKAYLNEFFDIFEKDTGIDLETRLNKYIKSPKWRDD